MDFISKINQRISSIEHRFQGVSTAPGTFQQILSKVEQPNTFTAKKNAVSAATNDIGGIIQQTANKYGVDPKLAMAIAKTESNFSAEAVSSAGAVGVMQLMPETGQSLGVSNLYDAHENIDGGVRYLKQLLNTFGGDTVKAVAAYNAGPNAVQKYNGIPPYPETKGYVAKVMDLYR